MSWRDPPKWVPMMVAGLSLIVSVVAVYQSWGYGRYSYHDGPRGVVTVTDNREGMIYQYGGGKLLFKYKVGEAPSGSVASN